MGYQTHPYQLKRQALSIGRKCKHQHTIWDYHQNHNTIRKENKMAKKNTTTTTSSSTNVVVHDFTSADLKVLHKKVTGYRRQGREEVQVNSLRFNQGQERLQNLFRGRTESTQGRRRRTDGTQERKRQSIDFSVRIRLHAH